MGFISGDREIERRLRSNRQTYLHMQIYVAPAVKFTPNSPLAAQTISSTQTRERSKRAVLFAYRSRK